MLRSSSAHGQALFFNCNLALLKNNHPHLQTHQLVNCVQVIISNRNKILVSFSSKVLEHVLSNSSMGGCLKLQKSHNPMLNASFPQGKNPNDMDFPSKKILETQQEKSLMASHGPPGIPCPAEATAAVWSNDSSNTALRCRSRRCWMRSFSVVARHLH